MLSHTTQKINGLSGGKPVEPKNYDSWLQCKVAAQDNLAKLWRSWPQMGDKFGLKFEAQDVPWKVLAMMSGALVKIAWDAGRQKRKHIKILAPDALSPFDGSPRDSDGRGKDYINMMHFESGMLCSIKLYHHNGIGWVEQADHADYKYPVLIPKEL